LWHLGYPRFSAARKFRRTIKFRKVAVLVFCLKKSMRGELPVSIVLPTYNRAALLPRSIASLLGQTYGDFELIVVDDGSQDDSAAVVAKFADKRIRYVRHSQNRGVAASRNTGLAEARGAYIAFQDSDDQWMPEKLERQMRAFEEHPEAAVVYSDMHRVCSDGAALYLRSPTLVLGRLVNPQTRFWQSYMLAMQPALVRRACFDGRRFDEGLRSFDDLDFYLRVAQHYEFFHMKEPLVKYFETDGLTSDRRVELRDRRRLLRRYAAPLFESDPTFLLTESVNQLLRRSLMPIVNLHLTPL
jgi:glycosyltransferase involved in cell wall biosynthesis